MMLRKRSVRNLVALLVLVACFTAMSAFAAESGAAVPADAYAICKDPNYDACLDRGKKVPWEEYAAKFLGYPVKVVGIQVSPYADNGAHFVVIYVRKDVKK